MSGDVAGRERGERAGHKEKEAVVVREEREAEGGSGGGTKRGSETCKTSLMSCAVSLRLELRAETRSASPGRPLKSCRELISTAGKGGGEEAEDIMRAEEG